MPSEPASAPPPADERVGRVLALLDPAARAFRSALATTVEQVRGQLDRRRSTGNGTPSPLAVELGSFASGRIDPARFSQLLAKQPSLDEGALDRIERAARVLGEVAGRGDDLHLVDVPPGAGLRDEVSRALSTIGRAYGAAHLIEAARTGAGEADDSWLQVYPFRRWNRAERQIAPPLVVHVDGADLRAEGLAEFLDGGLRLVLLVRGTCAPAPLVRLVTPGVLVMQTGSVDDLERVARATGPAVAAVVPEGAVAFTHDPEGGARVWERITVHDRPQRGPRRALGGRSAWQQNDEMLQLEALAERPPEPPPVAEAAPGAPAGGAVPYVPADPADRLAAWLLSQADLSEASPAEDDEA